MLKLPDGFGQGPQVAGEVDAVETGTAVVWTLVVVKSTVLVVVVEYEDDQTPHVSDEGLVLPVGFTGAELGVVGEEGVMDVSQLPQDVEAEDGLVSDTGLCGADEVFSATGDVLEFPSQLPQDEDRAASDTALPLPQDSAGGPAGAICQPPQPPGPPCLSR
jgi:hypothetical protein